MRALRLSCTSLLTALAGAALLRCLAAADPGGTTEAGAPAALDAAAFAADVARDSPSPPDASLPMASCDAYCTLLAKNCTGKNAAYASLAQCLTICGTLPPGHVSDMNENTVGCRQYYAGASAATLPGVHCKSAGPFGGEKCGAGCSAFCKIAAALCKGAYASEPACINACASYLLAPDGGGWDASKPTGDSLTCREQYLLMSTQTPEACKEIGLASPACR